MSELKESRSQSDSKQIPLKSLEIHNFKSIQKAKVTFKPLTILVGQNSAGKSTLLQSLLLLAQNSESRDSSVLLNGPLFRGGKFVSCLNSLSRASSHANELYRRYSAETPEGEEDTGHKLLSSFEDNKIPLSFDQFLGSDVDTVRFMFDWHVRPRIQRIVRTRADLNRKLDRNPRFDFDLSIGYSIGVHAKNSSAGQIRSSYFSRSNVKDPTAVSQFSLFARQASDADGKDFVELAEEQYSILSNVEPVSEVFEKSEIPNVAKMFIHGQYLPGLKSIGYSGMFPSTYLVSTGPISNFLTKIMDFALNNARLKKSSSMGKRKSYSDNKEFKLKDFISTWVDFLDSNPKGGELGQERLTDFVNYLTARISQITEEIGNFELFVDRMLEELASDTYNRLVDHYVRNGLDKSDFDQSLFFAIDQIVGQEKFEEVSSSLSWSRSEDVRIPNFIFNLKERVVYLGPLREDPRSSYSYSQESSPFSPLGRKGEFTFNYIANDTEPRRYVLPDGSVSIEPIRLEVALKYWLEYFFGSDRLNIAPPSEHGLVVQFDGKSLENVGVGVSQILPVLTLCLIARSEQVVLLEQPELHLHPALQQRLAHFFSVLSSHGQQIIVETHSEYLITRLRLLVVQNLLSPETVQILFAEQDKVSGTSYYPIDITQDGNMTSWPDGFFDQATDDLAKIYEKVLNLPE